MKYMLGCVIGLAMAVSLVACNPSTVSMPTPAIAKVTVIMPEPSPTPIVCTDNPTGLMLDVRSMGNYRVQIAGRGFQAGEPLVLVATAQSTTYGTRIEGRVDQGVNADGAFSWDGFLLPPVGANPSTVIWNIAIVHSRGVKCTTVQVP